MKEVHSNGVFAVLEGGSAPSTAPLLQNPTPDAILLPEMRGLGVGFRLVKVCPIEIFVWNRLHILGGPGPPFSPVEITNVFSDTNGPGAGVRLVRRGA